MNYPEEGWAAAAAAPPLGGQAPRLPAFQFNWAFGQLVVLCPLTRLLSVRRGRCAIIASPLVPGLGSDFKRCH